MCSEPRLPRVVLTFLLLGAMAGCARNIPDASPADIPQLRQELQTSPGDPVVGTRLGIALYKDSDYQASEEVLAGVVEDGEPIGATYLYLGLAREAQEEWEGARTAYQTYLEVGRSDELKGEIRGRLNLMVRNELRRQARETLAQEARLGDTDPAPRSVAVFPFQLVSDDEELEPLRVALADMMITDLTLAGGLTVLERARIQSLLDEMALTEAGFTEEGTGARAGRMLRAEHVVQGALTTTGADQIRFDADVLNTASGGSAGEVAEEDALESLFDMEKEVVFGVLDVLNVQITPAEREAIDQNRSENILAFLAYGRGLQELDRGNYDAAAQFFDQAVGLDPGFGPAQAGVQEAAGLQQASSVSADDMAQAAQDELSEGAVQPPPPTANSAQTGETVDNTLANVDQGTSGTGSDDVLGGGAGTGGGEGGGTGTDRDAVQESTGQDTGTGTTTTTITIRIPRPGSGGSAGSGGSGGGGGR